ncbi:MAG TPA: Gfo/Idh/MocA family oxidoreductase, partial [Nitrososphaeraceae archaeon]|nr:Gfo/Idh/MocA family oxidoreductase [Nitrososphaeraceae archaeon]
MVTTATNLNVAVIGVGGWGKNHARVLRDLGALAAICDVNIQRSRELAKMYDAKPYDSVDRMLQEERKLDACIVCTPTTSHFTIAKKIMEKGINVFVEKPLSFSTKECEEMIELTKMNKVILTSGYIERFNPAVQDVKQIIENKQYGDLLMMEFHRENRMPTHVVDVGIIYDTSVHDIDTA